ncbi:hypothetical protein AB1N83_011109 [Pleurotus pulmonarius]
MASVSAQSQRTVQLSTQADVGQIIIDTVVIHLCFDVHPSCLTQAGNFIPNCPLDVEKSFHLVQVAYILMKVLRACLHTWQQKLQGLSYIAFAVYHRELRVFGRSSPIFGRPIRTHDSVSFQSSMAWCNPLWPICIPANTPLLYPIPSRYAGRTNFLITKHARIFTGLAPGFMTKFGY